MKRYTVKFTREGTSYVNATNVSASSASQAREQVLSKYNGKVKIVSVVEI